MRPPSRRCLLLFARAPRVEARRKGLPEAEALLRAVDGRIRQLAARVDGVDLVCCGPEARRSPGERWIPQRGAGFAERLARALADVHALGYEQVVVVPGDVPGLDERTIAEAFRTLERAPVVLGPSPDGGVYLIGCRGPADDLLRGVRWCSAHVTADLLARAPGAVLLDRRSDVDRARDLLRVRRDETVPRELRALVAGAASPSGALAFDAIAVLVRPGGAPDPARGPPLLS